MSEMEQVTDPLPPPPATAQPPRSRFWRSSATRIVLYILVSGALAFALTGGLSGLLKLSHIHTRHHHPLQSIAALAEGAVAASAVLAFWVMTRFVDRRPWATAGFTPRELLPQISAGFALGALLLSFGVGALWALGIYRVTGHGTAAFLLTPLVLYLAVAVFEETFFRGYLFQTLETRWGSGIALGATSLLFGLAHLANPVHGMTPLERLAGPAFICLEAGLPLGAAYLLTRRWWLPIGIHWAWDYFEGPVYGCPDSGTHDPHTLLHATLSGPVLLTGGPFGPEAGLVFLAVGTLTGVLLLCAAIKNGQWRSHGQRTA